MNCTVTTKQQKEWWLYRLKEQMNLKCKNQRSNSILLKEEWINLKDRNCSFYRKYRDWVCLRTIGKHKIWKEVQCRTKYDVKIISIYSIDII